MKYLEITNSIYVKFHKDVSIRKDSVDFSVIECDGKYYEPVITFVERDLNFEETREISQEEEKRILSRLGFNEAIYRELSEDEIKNK